jgi:hypothetical protein
MDNHSMVGRVFHLARGDADEYDSSILDVTPKIEKAMNATTVEPLFYIEV